MIRVQKKQRQFVHRSIRMISILYMLFWGCMHQPFKTYQNELFIYKKIANKFYYYVENDYRDSIPELLSVKYPEKEKTEKLDLYCDAIKWALKKCETAPKQEVSRYLKGDFLLTLLYSCYPEVESKYTSQAIILRFSRYDHKISRIQVTDVINLMD